jgi:protein SCO1
MNNSSLFQGWIRWVLLSLTVMIIFAVIVIRMADQSRAALPEYGAVPEFAFTNHFGEPITRADLNGKLHIVDFIFTSCPSACPVMSKYMAELYELYKDSDKVRFLSFSVDPDTDTLPVLRQYAQRYGVDDDSWIFARGPIEEIKNLSEQGFMLPADGLPMGHSTKFVLVDENGNIRGFYDGMDWEKMEVLMAHVQALAKELP